MKRELYRRIRKYCLDNKLIKNNMGIVTGVSGGADSVFLLIFLIELRKEFDINICAVHVNHGIRGEEALRDENYVLELTERYGVPCRVFHKDIPAMSEEFGMTEEEAGRIYRYQCFEEVRSELDYDVVAVAHHQDDQAETILFQMLRGSSLRGLGGMKPGNGRIIRPLLDIRRADIENELKDENVAYCNDSTNEQDEYARNQIRHNIIPFIEKNIQSAAVAHLAKTASQLRDVSLYIDRIAEQTYKNKVRKCDGKVSINISGICDEDIVILRELVLMMMENVSGRRKDITSKHIETIIQLMNGDTGKRINLPYNMIAGRDYDELWIKLKDDTYNNHDTAIKEEVIAVDPDGCARCQKTDGSLQIIRFSLKNRDELPETVVKNNCTKWFDYAKINSALKLRHPKAGDFIWLKPDGTKKKLSRVLIDCKVPVDLRKNIWVLADEEHILWIPEIGRCSAYYYVDDNTEKVLCADLN